MHTATMIAAGLALLAIFTVVGRSRGTVASAMLAFLVVWLLVAIGNLWVGVTQAGYTVAQELPINAVVYAVPALAALAVRKFLR